MSAHTSVSPLVRPTPRRLQGGRVGSLEFALTFIAVFAALIGLIQIGVGLFFSHALWAVLEFTALFWIWAVAGICAWWRRPTNGIGGLLLVGAIAILLGSVGYLDSPVLNVVSGVFGTSILAVAVHLLHAFPSGRLRGRFSVVTVGLGYVTCIGFDLILTVSDNAVDVSFLQSMVGLAVMVLTAILLAKRLVTADAAHRRVLFPLFAYGILAVLGLPLVPNVLRPLGMEPFWVSTSQALLMAGLPIAFLLGVLLGGFTRTTPLEALSQWLAIPGASRPAVAQALAATLGDRTLRVAYWDPAGDRFIDEHGAEVADASTDDDRGWLHVRVDDDLVGAIDYDARMIAEPWPVRRAAEVLAIALDRERLTTQLLTSNEALILSRVRIVEAADRERSRIARDLHDGLQMQLVLLAIEAQTIANSSGTPGLAVSAEKLRHGIDRAAADLRRLVHDVLPAALLEQGLIAATEDLMDRLAVPATLHAELDETVITTATAHTAYFIIAETLANTVKHARASRVRVTIEQRSGWVRLEVEDDGVGGAAVSRGSGLRGLGDRVDALNGNFEVLSARDRGTIVRVELPCAS